MQQLRLQMLFLSPSSQRNVECRCCKNVFLQNSPHRVDGAQKSMRHTSHNSSYRRHCLAFENNRKDRVRVLHYEQLVISIVLVLVKKRICLKRLF